MKRFHFPLERVRLWRAEQVTLEQLRLEQLVSHLARIREEKQQTLNARLQSEQQILAQLRIDATDLENLAAYRLHIGNKIRELGGLERQAEGALIEQRRRLIQARRDAELLERLKQKALEDWQAAADREQETLASELFLAKRVREM